MAIDVSQFHSINVTDTCAIWNVLSSYLIFNTATDAGCSFCCTRYVHYECLHKPRKVKSVEDSELQLRLQKAQEKGKFIACELSVDDLQHVELLEARKRLSKGELSSIAFAMHTGNAFLTDDQKARKLATNAIGGHRVQTTPHLFGWLFFKCHLRDNDKDIAISQHREMNRPLAEYFNEMYLEALRCRVMCSPPPDQSSE